MMKSLPQEPDQLVRRSDLDNSLDSLRSELRIEMRDLTNAQTRTLMLCMVGSVTALAVTELLVNVLA